MIKRLCIVLAIIAAIVFVPYWVGRVLEPNEHPLMAWPIGCVAMVGAAALGAVMFLISVALIHIKNGNN